MNNNKTSPRIAVIGPSQSGKTCLAVGLFSTSTRGFSIEVPNINDRNYLIELRKKIVGGKWPDPTNKGTVQSLRFDFHKKRRQDIKVEFIDFGGEKLGDDEEWKKFANAHFCNLDGVVLLVNPGADAFQKNDPTLLEDAKTQYHRLLSFLHDPNNKSSDAFVALAVTAADRIRGINADLRGKDAEFRDCLEEIENTLSSMGFRWRKKPFYISMSGSTGRENKFERHSVPKGWPNTTPRPFLWILDRLGWQSTIRNVVARFLKISGMAALFSAIAIGAWSYFASERTHQDIELHFDAGEKACVDPGTTPGSFKKAFENAVPHLNWLQQFNGWFYKSHAAKRYQELEPMVADMLCRWINREWDDLREEAVQRASNSRLTEVDNLFGRLQPKDSESGERLKALQERWEQEKPKLRESYAIAQIVGKLEKPLDDLTGIHGDEIRASLRRLYAEYSKLDISGWSTQCVARLDTFANHLDTRTNEEWQWWINVLDASAHTNATDDVVGLLLECFKGWNPVTTNGIAGKATLMDVATNSIPKWRDVYEKTTYEAKVKEALKSREMIELAKLYPPRVETNKYLTAEYVKKLWEEQCKPVFDNLRTNFLNGIIDSVVSRRGRPTLSECDKGKVESRASEVGAPFDKYEAMNYVVDSVRRKENEWMKKCKETAEKWIKESVREDQKRSGQGSLFYRYDGFVRKNDGNPFIKELVLPAVYAQVERWIAADIESFKTMRCENAYYRATAEERYNQFKKLCREVVDRNKREIELKTSWVCYFAVACDKDSQLDAIDKCFPQKLMITNVFGKIGYTDFRWTYTGTDLSAKISVNPIGSDETIYTLVSDQKLGEKDNLLWRQIGFVTSEVQVHPFDIIKIKLKAIDKIRGVGRNLECDVSEPVSVHGAKLKALLEDGLTVCGIFDLTKATKYVGKDGWWHGRLTTNDTRPIACIKVCGTLSGKSVEDYVADAKTKVKVAKEENKAR